MKNILGKLTLFAFFAIVFAGLNGCGGSSEQQNVGSSNSAAGNESNSSPQAANTAASKNATTYPPLSSKLADARIELSDTTKTTVAERKGNVVLMNLWGVWCAPCRNEMPHLVEIQNQYRDKGFQILGLNVGNEDMEPESFEVMKKFGEEMGLNYELGRISTETGEEYARVSQFAGVPLSVLVDREGRMRGVFRGGGRAEINEMKKLVEKVVNE